MVVQLAIPSSSHDTLRILIIGDLPFSSLSSMSLSVTIPMFGLGESGCAAEGDFRYCRYSSSKIEDRDMLDPSGEAPNLLRTAAAVKVRE